MGKISIWLTELFILMSPAIFGVYSIISPSPSLASLTESAQWATYLLAIVASICLALGRYKGKFGAFVVGHIIAIVNIVTTAGVAFFTSYSPVAVWILSLAAVLGVSLQRAFANRRLLAAVAKGDA